MPGSDWSEGLVLAEWAEKECLHLDLIASWEVLMSVYADLGFSGPDSDEDRLAEFKFIIGEMNKFLTRMKNGLARTRDIDDAIEFLLSHMNTKDMNAVKGREQIAYNKLKQQWIYRNGILLSAMQNNTGTDEGERDD